MAGLLSAQAEAAVMQRFHDVTVAYFGLNHLNVLFLHSQAQAKVRHDRSHQRVVAQIRIVFHADGQNCHDLVTVDDVAFCINGQAAVGIPVVRQSEVRPVFPHGCLCLLNVCGSAVIVDVVGIGSVIDRINASTCRRIGFRGNLRRSTIRAVDDDVQAGKIRRTDFLQMLQVAFMRIWGFFHHTPDGRTGWA